MKTFKILIASLAIVLAVTAGSFAQLTGTCSIASSGQNYINILGTVTGTNGAASGGNLVNLTFVWSTVDGTNVLSSWTNSASPNILPAIGNGGSYTYQAGGLSTGGKIFARVLFSQPDGSTNLISWSGASQLVTLGSNAVSQATLSNSTIYSLLITGVNYQVGIDTTTNSAGAAIKVLKLTP